MLYTTKMIAKVTQVSPRYVQMIARRLNVPKHGRDYLVNQLHLVEIVKQIHKLEEVRGI